RLHGVRSRQLVDRDDRARLSVQMPGDGVVLRPELHPRDVADAYDPAVLRLAHDDLAELLRGRQAALGPDGVREFLALRDGLAADQTGGVNRVLGLDRGDDLGNGDRKLRELVGPDPQSHGIAAGAEDLNAADPRYARELIVEVDVGVVRQELRVVDAGRRIQV